MKRFNVWLEERENTTDAQKLKGIIFTALFSELDPLEADGNLDLKLSSLDPSQVRDMLKNMEIVIAMHGRDPKPIIKNGTVRDFLNWLSQENI